jgi:hypothetical protein
MADTIELEYTSNAGDVYYLELIQFLDDEFPRRIIGEAALERSILGMNYSSGPSVKHKNIWVINTLVRNEVTTRATKNGTDFNELQLLKQLYDAWDTDRANALQAKIEVNDNVLGGGVTYSSYGWFTEPPVYSLAGNYGSGYINAVFSLTEV